MSKKTSFSYEGENELIIKRRRRKFIKKLVIFLLLLTSIMTTLCLKHPFFSIKQIKVLNNKNISYNDIVKSSNIKIGQNIFYVNINQAKKNILLNPYITTVEIHKKLPNTVILSVKERIAAFYADFNGKYYIIDRNGVVLEIKNNIKGMKLVKLKGIDLKNVNIGQEVSVDDKRKIQVVQIISSLIGNEKENFGISFVDISNITNINMYYKNICIKLGNTNDLETKINKALNIIQQRDNIKTAKQGYIDVSFKGNPIIFIK